MKYLVTASYTISKEVELNTEQVLQLTEHADVYSSNLFDRLNKDDCKLDTLEVIRLEEDSEV